MRRKYVPFGTLQGKTVTRVSGASEGSDKILFGCSDGSEYMMLHERDCCESVYLESVDADLNEILVGQTVLVAEEIDSGDTPPLNEHEESYTWTFYKLATAKGWATLRWYGSSNGYYSESVDFYEATPAREAVSQ